MLVAGGVFAFYWFAQWPTALRALTVAGGVLLGAIVFALTAKGAQTREFLSESRFELRKVVWPTRQEAMRTTWVVMLAVADFEPDPGWLRRGDPGRRQVPAGALRR